LKEAVLDLEAYAMRDLHQLPSYLEAVKECCEQMLEKASTPELSKNLKKQATVWKDCINLKFAIKGVPASKNRAKPKDVKKAKFLKNLLKGEKKEKYMYFGENLLGQQRERATAMVKLLENGSDGHELIHLANGNGLQRYNQITDF
jgi:hypothetical protein